MGATDFQVVFKALAALQLSLSWPVCRAFLQQLSNQSTPLR